MAVLKGHTKWVTSLAWSPLHNHNQYLCSAGKDLTIRIWTVPNNTCHKVLSGHKSCITKLLWGGDDRLYSASEDKSMIQFIFQLLKYGTQILELLWLILLDTLIGLTVYLLTLTISLGQQVELLLICKKTILSTSYKPSLKMLSTSSSKNRNRDQYHVLMITLSYYGQSLNTTTTNKMIVNSFSTTNRSKE